MDVAALRRKIEILNEKIRPIAEKTVEFGPDMLRGLRFPEPDAAVQATLVAAIDLYLESSAETREEIREIFRKNAAFAWAATLPFPPDSAERFRQQLVHFSIIDQGTDARDAVLWLAHLCAAWHDDEIRREVAQMSSDVDRYGFGSTKKLISGQ